MVVLIGIEWFVGMIPCPEHLEHPANKKRKFERNLLYFILKNT
jgi:hypothetical protein